MEGAGLPDHPGPQTPTRPRWVADHPPTQRRQRRRTTRRGPPGGRLGRPSCCAGPPGDTSLLRAPVATIRRPPRPGSHRSRREGARRIRTTSHRPRRGSGSRLRRRRSRTRLLSPLWKRWRMGTGGRAAPGPHRPTGRPPPHCP